jgi:hypothetical protein
MGVLGAPLQHGGDMNSIYKYLSRLPIAKWDVSNELAGSRFAKPLRADRLCKLIAMLARSLAVKAATIRSCPSAPPGRP